MYLSDKVMQGTVPKWYLVILSSLSLGSLGSTLCTRGTSWWDRQKGICVPCTTCDPEHRQAIKLPCELHRDTVCQSLDDLKIFPFNERRNFSDVIYEYYDYEDTSDVLNSDSVKWDIQTSSTLTIALSGCIVFFVVVIFLTVYHAKQWRVLKHALKSDVQDLTAKLRLMESGPDTQNVGVISNNHHIYCNIQEDKRILNRPDPTSNKKGTANVYIQEKHVT